MNNQGNIVQLFNSRQIYEVFHSSKAPRTAMGPPAYYSIGIRSFFLKDKTVEA
jgi:hypothetical protein